MSGSRNRGEIGVYYVDVQGAGNATPIQRRVGIGGRHYPHIMLGPDEALSLLEWLLQEKQNLELLEKEQEK